MPRTDGVVHGRDLCNESVTSRALAPESVTGDKIAAGAVATALGMTVRTKQTSSHTPSSSGDNYPATGGTCLVWEHGGTDKDLTIVAWMTCTVTWLDAVQRSPMIKMEKRIGTGSWTELSGSGSTSGQGSVLGQIGARTAQILAHTADSFTAVDDDLQVRAFFHWDGTSNLSYGGAIMTFIVVEADVHSDGTP